MLPATLCRVASVEAFVMSKSVLTLSLTKPSRNNAEAILKTSELIIYGEVR
jgi:hypothetical protein